MNEEKVIQKLIDHDEQLEFIRENMATKSELQALVDGQDQMITILKRLDEERVFTYEMVKRIEGRVDDHDRELQKTRQDVLQLKTRLNVA